MVHHTDEILLLFVILNDLRGCTFTLNAQLITKIDIVKLDVVNIILVLMK